MGIELWNLFSGYIRAYIIGISGQAVGVAICSELLRCRKNKKKLFLFLMIKTALTMYLNAFLNYYFLEHAWAVVTNTLVTTFVALATWLMFAYTFEGGLLKCNLAMNLSEIIAGTVMLPSVMLVNILQSRQDLFSFYGEFRMLDLLIIGIEAVLCLLICRLTAQLLKKFRDYKIRYERVWWVIILFYTIFMQAVAMIDLRDGRMFMITMYILYLGCAAVGVTGMILIYRSYTDRIRKRSVYLENQLKLISVHYASVQEKMIQMENCRQTIDNQIEKIVRLNGNKEYQARTREYLEAVREEYEKMRKGLYCNDWLIDAVLFCQIETAENCGITTVCDTAGYDRGGIQEEKLAQILFHLFDFSIRENQKMGTENERCIRIKMQVVMSRLVIEFETTAKKKRKYSLAELEELIQLRDDTISMEKEADRVRLLITLKR